MCPIPIRINGYCPLLLGATVSDRALLPCQLRMGILFLSASETSVQDESAPGSTHPPDCWAKIHVNAARRRTSLVMLRISGCVVCGRPNAVYRYDRYDCNVSCGHRVSKSKLVLLVANGLLADCQPGSCVHEGSREVVFVSSMEDCSRLNHH